jgi:hypothetical protein
LHPSYINLLHSNICQTPVRNRSFSSALHRFVCHCPRSCSVSKCFRTVHFPSQGPCIVPRPLYSQSRRVGTSCSPTHTSATGGRGIDPRFRDQYTKLHIWSLDSSLPSTSTRTRLSDHTLVRPPEKYACCACGCNAHYLANCPVATLKPAGDQQGKRHLQVKLPQSLQFTHLIHGYNPANLHSTLVRPRPPEVRSDYS